MPNTVKEQGKILPNTWKEPSKILPNTSIEADKILSVTCMIHFINLLNTTKIIVRSCMIYSKSWHGHVKTLSKIFQRNVRKSGMNLVI